MNETERALARWAMDSAANLRVGLDDFYIEVRLRKLKGGGMEIEQLHPYRHAKLTIDPSTLNDVYFARLSLAHELGHLICNDVLEAAARAGAESMVTASIEVVCDRIAVLAVGRIDNPPNVAAS
jgi:hypothetical protein